MPPWPISLTRRYPIPYKSSYTDVKGLFQLDSQGYYYYEMRRNFTEFSREGGNHFILHGTPAVDRAEIKENTARKFGEILLVVSKPVDVLTYVA